MEDKWALQRTLISKPKVTQFTLILDSGFAKRKVPFNLKKKID